MVVGGKQTAIGESDIHVSDPHPLDRLIPDPFSRQPLCGEEKFAEILEGIVADAAPRLFAIVQEYGQRVDARIAGWGRAFPNRADVVSLDGGLQMSLHDARDALHAFHVGTHVRARLVWFNPDAGTLGKDLVEGSSV